MSASRGRSLVKSNFKTNLVQPNVIERDNPENIPPPPEGVSVTNSKKKKNVYISTRNEKLRSIQRELIFLLSETKAFSS